MRLLRLKIKNFAIIREIDVEFKFGFTVLTGETGAGKTIIIDALNLALGDKASTSVVRAESDYAVVECTFQLNGAKSSLTNYLRSKHIDTESNLLTFRREIQVNGRSKAWINGKPCPITVLKEAGDLLVDLHGQHDHQSLLNQDSHIDFLDAYGDYNELISGAKNLWQKLRLLKERYEIQEQKRKLNKEKRELWEFQLEEIQKVAPKRGEYEELLKEKTLLENAEKIHTMSEEIIGALYENDDALYHRILGIIKKFVSMNKVHPAFDDQINHLEQAQYLFQDIASQISKFARDLQFDPVRLEKINQRIYLLQQIMKKYGPEISDIISHGEKLQMNLNEDDGLDVEIRRLAKEIGEATSQFSRVVRLLSQKRTEQAVDLESALEKVLNRLGITGSRFKVEIRQDADPHGWAIIDGKNVSANEKGIDRVAFLISTNPGEPLRPLVEIVSGGEISRIMLALKSILAGRDRIPVLIFDEIDIGISGHIARIVGEELRDLAKYHQILCITHLPQIAGLGMDHLRVNKVTVDGRSSTQIDHLSKEERIEEIAKLIGGKSISKTTRQQARELLN